jgi:hypothetical protein
MGKSLFAPPPRADAWSEAEFHKALATASDPISLIRAPRRRLATPRSSVRRLRTRASCAGGRSARGGVLPRDRILWEWSSTRVSRHRRLRQGRRDFLATAAVVRSTLGISLVPGKRRKQTWARCPPPSSRASSSAGPRSIPPAATCRGLTRKSEFGDFSLGPILMAQINSRRQNKKRA